MPYWINIMQELNRYMTEKLKLTLVFNLNNYTFFYAKQFYDDVFVNYPVIELTLGKSKNNKWSKTRDRYITSINFRLVSGIDKKDDDKILLRSSIKLMDIIKNPDEADKTIRNMARMLLLQEEKRLPSPHDDDSLEVLYYMLMTQSLREVKEFLITKGLAIKERWNYWRDSMLHELVRTFEIGLIVLLHKLDFKFVNWMLTPTFIPLKPSISEYYKNAYVFVWNSQGYWVKNSKKVGGKIYALQEIMNDGGLNKTLKKLKMVMLEANTRSGDYAKFW